MAQPANPIVTIHMQDGGKMKLELFPDPAPITTANFTELIESGHYDGLTFHRVVEGFMIQGGSKNNSCAGKDADFSIRGEFARNGINTGISHTRGTISMARSGHPDSAGTQFFIMQQDGLFLDGDYAAFGRIIDSESLAVLDKIASVPTKSVREENRPLTPQVIERITYEPGGYNRPAPMRIFSED